MSRKLSTRLAAIGGVGLLVVLIGVLTLFASQLINETVVDQYRSQELQLVSSLSQQTETYFAGLNADITSLALQPVVKEKRYWYDDAIAQLGEHAQDRPTIIRSVMRFDCFGNPRYAWPRDLNDRLQDGDDPPYDIPSRFIRLLADDKDAPFEIELIPVTRVPSGESSFLLIAPVSTSLGDTEFLTYELNLDQLFIENLGFVLDDLRADEQLWVIDNLNRVMFQANQRYDVEDLLRKIPLVTLTSYRSPIIERESIGGDDKLTLVAPIRTQGNSFVVILLRDLDAAQQGVQSDLQLIFGLSVGVIVLVAGMGWLVMYRLSVEERRRQQEVQRRQTARTLLEVSRALNSTLDLQDVLRSIMAELSNIVPYDSAAILLLDRSKLAVAAHRGADAAEHEADVIDLNKAHAANRVLQTGRPLVIDDTTTDERWTSVMAKSRIRSWMGIPLRVRDKTVGVLNINSHQVNRFSVQEVELAEAFADQASVALQNARLHELEVKQIEQELSIARQIQTSLLPAAVPPVPQLDIASVTLPARQVSGDYYQYLPMPNGRLGVAIGDVSGKGIPAAMLMAVVTTAMRDELGRNPRPARLLDALNKRLMERVQSTHLNTALLVGVFDPPTRHLELANGGMVQPYVRNGKSWEFVPVGGYPLGVTSRMSYSSKTITLAPGAILLSMSDGVIEAQNAGGEFYGFERLEALLATLPEEITAQQVIDRILAAIREHLGEAEPQDDLTILALRAVEVPAEQRAKTSPAAATGDGNQGTGEDGADAADAQTTGQDKPDEAATQAAPSVATSAPAATSPPSGDPSAPADADKAETKKAQDAGADKSADADTDANTDTDSEKKSTGPAAPTTPAAGDTQAAEKPGTPDAASSGPPAESGNEASEGN